jgi:hypothetical protein
MRIVSHTGNSGARVELRGLIRMDFGDLGAK